MKLGQLVKVCHLIFHEWRHQAITWTTADLLAICSLGRNCSEISIEIQTFSFHENAFDNVICEMAAILLGFKVL